MSAKHFRPTSNVEVSIDLSIAIRPGRPNRRWIRWFDGVIWSCDEPAFDGKGLNVHLTHFPLAGGVGDDNLDG